MFFCKPLKDAIKLEWEALLYKVGGKIFALIGCNNEGKELISLKNEPEINITIWQPKAIAC
ncbi:MAG TPA: hypothetical protein PLS05_03240 [Clostridia bacterium]|nr:hypothetical protein [Clostridia bacterium]HOL60875.1 hypothetical protein [Clostridia bacterium]HPO53619.1 hypothetical protein [Clostridia bacterium]